MIGQKGMGYKVPCKRNSCICALVICFHLYFSFQIKEEKCLYEFVEAMFTTKVFYIQILYLNFSSLEVIFESYD